MTPDLKILADNRDALLLAEVGAWLHDMGKCADSFLKPDGMGFNAKNCKDNLNVNPHKAVYSSDDLKNLPYWNKLSTDRGQCSRLEEANHSTALWKTLNQLNIDVNKLDKKVQINVLGYETTIRELILWGRPLVSDNYKNFKKILRKSIELAAYLGRSHQAAHIEKEEGGRDQTGNIFLSSPFGYEKEKLESLNNRIKDVLNSFLQSPNDFNTFNNTLEKNFRLAAGDTRRPINEVTLWDWSSIVAALYKSALAGALLGNKPEPNDLKWRLMAIRFNSEQIWGNASKIPVLFAGKKWLSDGLDNVKNLLEKTYPLGNEVYRDENGSIFVVPDIKNLLKIKDSEKDQALGELISEKLGYDAEVVVTPKFSDSWWGQKPPNHPILKDDKTPPIGKMLKEKPYSPPDPETVKKWWEDAISKAQKEGRNNPEICNISWLRPQGPTKKGFQRKASDYWAGKVRGSAKDWTNSLNKTIWIDEVADSNGRICLIVGKLDIKDWLSPDGCINTLFVKPPNGDPKNAVPKTPSFARIRRVWETTKKFWEDVEQDFKETVNPIDERLKIIGEFKPKNGNNHLLNNNAYEADLNGVRFSIFNSNNKGLLVIENLQWLAKKMGAKQKDLEPYESSVEYVKREIEDKPLKIYDPEGENREKPIGLLKVSKIEDESTSYTPAISILSEPSTFMAIVPANKAMEVAKCIKEKYEKEIGKVRNRLPLAMGMVFAKSHTPLVALMDAGKRMLKIPTEEEDWVLNGDAEDCNNNCILNFNDDIIWKVSVKMRDGITDDVWYPYFYVNGVPKGRSRAFKSPKGWLVHVKELKKGDRVKVTPSRFDFEFLDTSSRRFEVIYDSHGKRRGTTKSERPYLLDELDNFERLWNILSEKLSRSQIKNIIGLIETKREEWLPEDRNDVFEKLVHDVLHNANWRGEIPTNIGELEQAAISGKLRDIVEFYMDILKVGNADEKEHEVFK